MPCTPIPIGAGRFASEASAEVTIFDFGALSVDHRIPFADELPELARLSSALYDHVGPSAAAARAAVPVAQCAEGGGPLHFVSFDLDAGGAA